LSTSILQAFGGLQKHIAPLLLLLLRALDGAGQMLSICSAGAALATLTSVITTMQSTYHAPV